MNTNRWWAADRQFVSTKKTSEETETEKSNHAVIIKTISTVSPGQEKGRLFCSKMIIPVPRQDIVALKISLIASHI